MADNFELRKQLEKISTAQTAISDERLEKNQQLNAIRDDEARLHRTKAELEGLSERVITLKSEVAHLRGQRLEERHKTMTREIFKLDGEFSKLKIHFQR